MLLWNMETIRELINRLELLEGELEAKNKDQEYIDRIFFAIEMDYSDLKEEYQTKDEILF